MVEVKLWGSLAASAGGTDKLDIEAKDIRELLRKLAEQYPGVEPYLRRHRGLHQWGNLSRQLVKGAAARTPRSSCCRAWLVDRPLMTRL